MHQGHGDDSYLFKRQIIADFSTNVYSNGEPVGLKEHLFEHWKEINRYPEVLAESLCSKVAVHLSLDPSEVLIVNGSAESIYLIAQTFQGSKTTVVVPTFSEYEDACKLNGHQLKFLFWEDLKEDSPRGTDLLFICNPNNPTGLAFVGLEKLVSANPKTLFVVDEAFIEFTIRIKTLIPLIRKYKNLIVLRSLTKAFAIPGLRLGYIVTSPDLIKKITQFKLPWSVNTLALKAGHFIFEHYKNLQLPLEKILESKSDFMEALSALPFLKLNSSDTHFFIVETLIGTSKELKSFLIEKYGILIRDASNFRALSTSNFRLSTLSDEKNNLLVEALKEWKNRF